MGWCAGAPLGPALREWSRIGREDVVTGLRLMRAGFDELGDAKPALRFMIPLMAEALGHAGQIADGLTAITEAIEQSEDTKEFLLIAELLRIKGELLLMQDAQGAATGGRGSLSASARLARRQGVLFGTTRRHEPHPTAAQSGPFR
jgi:hypothetical protein